MLKRLNVIIILILIISTGIAAGYFLKSKGSVIGKPISNKCYTSLDVPENILDNIGLKGNVSQIINGSTIWNYGKVTLIYVGADYCPYCAASYSSSTVIFEGYEIMSRNYVPQQQLPISVQTLMKEYDPQGIIPFLDIDNRYIIIGSQYSPLVIRGLSWFQICSQLGNPKSNIADEIDGSANLIIHYINNSIINSTGT